MAKKSLLGVTVIHSRSYGHLKNVLEWEPCQF